MERLSLRRVVSPEEATTLVGTWVGEHEPTHSEPFIATDADTGETVMAVLPVEAPDLRRACLSLKYTDLRRASGAKNLSANFGYQPRRPSYSRDACRASGVAKEFPAAEAALDAWAGVLARMLREIDAKIEARDRETMLQVGSSWKLGDSELWTSGVINRSSTLPYHRDGFNFPTWSAMPVFRRGMTGGHLHIPEYGVVLPCRDSTAVFFPGHQLVHGVTPMQLRKPDGYRLSVVYYALKGMKSCLEGALETEYAQKARTAREQNQARLIAERRQPK